MTPTTSIEDTVITCVVCGLRFRVSEGRSTCESCPLHKACSTVCCPNCGTSNIIPERSVLARWLNRALKGDQHAL